MARWLAPAHNPAPSDFTASLKNWDADRQNSEPNPYGAAPRSNLGIGSAKNPNIELRREGIFELPAGIDQIIAVDPQNALLVYGTEEGFRQLQALVTYLDKPIPQVEIEVQFVEVTGTPVDAFGIDWSGASNGPFAKSITGLADKPGPGTFSLGYLRGNFQAALKAMIAQGKAKLLSSPRVTAMNNLTSRVYTTTSVPVVLGLKDDKGNFRELINAANPDGSAAPHFHLTTQFGFTVTPTINNDKTITLVMQPSPLVSLTVANDKRHSLPLATQTVQTIANLRDGDTIALGGLRSQMLKAENLLAPDEDDLTIKQGGDLILFVTARIIRRVEDSKAPAPGQ